MLHILKSYHGNDKYEIMLDIRQRYDLPDNSQVNKNTLRHLTQN